MEQNDCHDRQRKKVWKENEYRIAGSYSGRKDCIASLQEVGVTNTDKLGKGKINGADHKLTGNDKL